jgi:hypothetical protein
MTKVVRNTQAPIWNDEVSLGILLSGTEVTISLWDYDVGFELADDFLAQSKMRVPFCSFSNAPNDEHLCNAPFDCAVEDSLWKVSMSFD